MSDLYIITAVKIKNPRVNNLKYYPGDTCTLETLKNLAADEAFTYERIPSKYGFVVRLYDYYNNILIEAVSF
ncbi:MAG: hypothetical protein HF314_12095 [Ignavibacteria bacterium]|jgi:hypothetical protein|nr:hypothetical protein [Ignavibacteria bacterium]MCU7503812.1 hypothetical protein [Ignavibacteria bacterium]MCU7517174.1 hypothetical protein [Ignavibacteria bacterium]